MPGNKIVPKGSMCFAGLKLTRPSRQAVSSPSRCATKPCAASWSVMAMITGNAQTVARYITLSLTALSSLHGHWQSVPRPQGDETSGFYGMASLETQPIALSDRCKNQNCFRHCKGRANANALTRSERNVGEPWGLGGKSVWVETMRLIPERCLAV